jgi:hypothetical protein
MTLRRLPKVFNILRHDSCVIMPLLQEIMKMTRSDDGMLLQVTMYLTDQKYFVS